MECVWCRIDYIIVIFVCDNVDFIIFFFDCIFVEFNCVICEFLLVFFLKWVVFLVVVNGVVGFVVSEYLVCEIVGLDVGVVIKVWVMRVGFVVMKGDEYYKLKCGIFMM